MMKLFYIFLSIFCTNSFSLKLDISRRAIISMPQYIGTTKTIDFLNTKKNNTDNYAKWSLYGLVAPPIEKTINLQQLLTLIDQDYIAILQIAVQHDCLIATTNIGHRYAVLVKDKEIYKLFNQLNSNSTNIIILPIDEPRQRVRTIAQTILSSSLLFNVLTRLNIIKYRFKAFNSIAERDAYYKNNSNSF